MCIVPALRLAALPAWRFTCPWPTWLVSQTLLPVMQTVLAGPILFDMLGLSSNENTLWSSPVADA